MIHSGQPTVQADSDFRCIWSFVTDVRTDGRMYGLTDNLCENNDHFWPPLWPAMWIKKKEKRENLETAWKLTIIVEKHLTRFLENAIIETQFLQKTGVVNDPLGQTYSLASSEHCFRLKIVLFL